MCGDDDDDGCPSALDRMKANTVKHYAKVAYDAYCRAVGGKSAVTGDPLPEYEKTNEKVQAGWRAAAEAILYK